MITMLTLVTGGTGFVGGAVVRALLARGEKVRVLSRPQSDRRLLDALDIEIVGGDLGNFESLRRAVRGCRNVYHMAAEYSLWARDPSLLYISNVDGTKNMIRAATDAGIERMVYTSTVGTLGNPGDGTPGTEETAVTFAEMTGDYKKSKFLAEEEVLHAARSGFPAVVVNPSAPVGPGDYKPTPTGQMIVDYLNGKMFGYIDTGLNVIDVDDVAAGHLLAMDKGRIGERYILGNRNMALIEIFEALGDISGIKPPGFRVPYPLLLPLAVVNEWLSDHVTHRPPLVSKASAEMAKKKMFFDASKAVRELGLPQHPVENALGRAVRWYWDHGLARRPVHAAGSAVR